MQINVGTPDRAIRLVLGLALVALPFLSGWPLFANALLQWGSVVVGLVLIVTASLRICPLYSIFGLSTCKVSDR